MTMLKATWQVADSTGQMVLEEVHFFESTKLRFEERLAILEFREKKPLRSILLFDYGDFTSRIEAEEVILPYPQDNTFSDSAALIAHDVGRVSARIGEVNSADLGAESIKALDANSSET